MRRNTLMIDADDTLWENNVFFEKLIEDFITLVEPCGYTRSYIRHILNETERKNHRPDGARRGWRIGDSAGGRFRRSATRHVACAASATREARRQHRGHNPRR